MKRFARISALALCVGGIGGMAYAEEISGSQELTPGLYAGRFLEPIQVRNCWYFISSEMSGRGAPAALIVRRLPTRNCEGASRVLARTYDSSTLLATRQGDELVVATSVRMWPRPLQGAIQLFHISTDTLENLRPLHNELLASGGTSASRMYFEGQALIVQGSRSGGFPEESGSGPYYTATFERFLSSDAPASIVAHEDAPPAEPTPGVTDGGYLPLEGLYHLPFKVKDCWYFATATRVIPGWDLAQLRVTRLAVNRCEGRTVGLDLSYDPETFLVTIRGESAIALAWSMKSTPPFINSSTHVKLYNLSPDTLTNQRTANNQLFSSTGGKVHATRMDFDGHRLVVEGTKDGVLVSGSPESGSGPHYTATYERFLDGEEPPSVIAY